MDRRAPEAGHESKIVVEWEPGRVDGRGCHVDGDIGGGGGGRHVRGGGGGFGGRRRVGSQRVRSLVGTGGRRGRTSLAGRTPLPRALQVGGGGGRLAVVLPTVGVPLVRAERGAGRGSGRRGGEGGEGPRRLAKRSKSPLRTQAGARAPESIRAGGGGRRWSLPRSSGRAWTPRSPHKVLRGRSTGPRDGDPLPRAGPPDLFPSPGVGSGPVGSGRVPIPLGFPACLSATHSRGPLS